MTTFALAQAVVIGVIVAGSAVFAFRRLLPGLSTRWMAAASASLNKPWRKAWVQAIGRWLQPASATGNCGDGCGTCGSCGPKPPANAQLGKQPLEFRPRNAKH